MAGVYEVIWFVGYFVLSGAAAFFGGVVEGQRHKATLRFDCEQNEHSLSAQRDKQNYGTK
jgi:hypothetical protein